MGYAERVNGASKAGYTGLILPKGYVRSGGKVVVSYPSGGNVTVAFQHALEKMIGYEYEKKPEDRLLGRVHHIVGLYIADNRNYLAARFLETSNIEWMLQVDTDIHFQPQLLEQFLAIAGDDKKVIAASVPLGAREMGAHPTCAYRATATPGVFEHVERLPPHPIKVDGVATACILIHRDVLLAIADREGQAWFLQKQYPDPKNKPDGAPRDFKWMTQGEDLSFSTRVIDAGYDIWCAYIPGLSHYKTIPLSHDYQLATEMAAAATDGMGEIVPEG